MAAKPKARKKTVPKAGNSLVNDPTPVEMVEVETIDFDDMTTGYRDGNDCVETGDFPFGKALPKAWADTPAKLKNYKGNEDTNFQKVD